MRQDALLHRRHVDDREFQALGGVQGHDRYAVLPFVVAVHVVVALLARRDAALGEDALRLQERRVRVGAQMREVDPAEDAVPVDVVPLAAPEVLLRLAHLG